MNSNFHRFERILRPVLIAVLLGACSTAVNWNYPRVPSNAFTYPETTTVDALFQEASDKHPGLSGFSLVQHGENAFLARLAMVDLAEKTLDAQYYIWDSDTTGRILASRIMRAARPRRTRAHIDRRQLSNGRQRLCDCGAGRPPQHRDTSLQPRKEPVVAHVEFFG